MEEQDEQSRLSALLDAREELYQRGTQFIFEALKDVLGGIASFLEVDEDSIDWAGVERLREYIIIAGIVHTTESKNGRPIRIGIPLHLAETAKETEIIDFLQQASIKIKAQKLLHSADENSFDLQHLTQEQLEKVRLSLPILDDISFTIKH